MSKTQNKDDKTVVGKLLSSIWGAIVEIWESIQVQVIKDPDKRGIQIHIWIEGRRVTRKPVNQKEAAAILHAIKTGNSDRLLRDKNLRKRSRLAAIAKATPELIRQHEKSKEA